MCKSPYLADTICEQPLGHFSRPWPNQELLYIDVTQLLNDSFPPKGFTARPNQIGLEIVLQVIVVDIFNLSFCTALFSSFANFDLCHSYHGPGLYEQCLLDRSLLQLLLQTFSCTVRGQGPGAERSNQPGVVQPVVLVGGPFFFCLTFWGFIHS